MQKLKEPSGNITGKEVNKEGNKRVTKTYYHPTIALCRNCQGSGRVMIYDSPDLLRMNGKEDICPVCQGSGRVIVSKLLETVIKPFREEGGLL